MGKTIPRKYQQHFTSLMTEITWLSDQVFVAVTPMVAYFVGTVDMIKKA